MFGKIFSKLQSAVNALTGLGLGVMVIIIFIQVIMRYVVGRSISWSEELTRYMFVWLIYLGVNLGIKSNSQIKIDVVDGCLKGNAKKVLTIVQHLLSLVAICAAAYGSIQLMKVGFLATSPSLHLPMWMIYLVFPIGFVLDFVEVVHQIYLQTSSREGE